MEDIDAREFQWWRAYSNIEPLGEKREDMRAGLICALIANTNRDSKSKPTPYTVEEFMYPFKKTPKLPTKKELKAKFNAFVKSQALLHGNSKNDPNKHYGKSH